MGRFVLKQSCKGAIRPFYMLIGWDCRCSDQKSQNILIFPRTKTIQLLEVETSAVIGAEQPLGKFSPKTAGFHVDISHYTLYICWGLSHYWEISHYLVVQPLLGDQPLPGGSAVIGGSAITGWFSHYWGISYI